MTTKENIKTIRTRYGCDCCKTKGVATERFDGYLGNTLWICYRCRLKLQNWKGIVKEK